MHSTYSLLHILYIENEFQSSKLQHFCNIYFPRSMVVCGRSKGQQDSFDRESKTTNPKKGDKKMLFERFITDKTEAGLVNGLVDMIHASWSGTVSTEQLYAEFPDGPDHVVNTFRERYPDVVISNNEEIRRQVESKLKPEITRAIATQNPLERLMLELGIPVEYITVPNCDDPNCQNPACPNYKGRKKLSGKSKIGYVN